MDLHNRDYVEVPCGRVGAFSASKVFSRSEAELGVCFGTHPRQSPFLGCFGSWLLAIGSHRRSYARLSKIALSYVLDDAESLVAAG
jgi:hypothetical protein